MIVALEIVGVLVAYFGGVLLLWLFMEWCDR